MVQYSIFLIQIIEVLLPEVNSQKKIPPRKSSTGIQFAMVAKVLTMWQRIKENYCNTLIWVQSTQKRKKNM
jgi:hypothetical protein